MKFTLKITDIYRNFRDVFEPATKVAVPIVLVICLLFTLTLLNSASAEVKQLPAGTIKGSNENPKVIKITNPLINAKTKTVTKPIPMQLKIKIKILETLQKTLTNSAKHKH